MIATMAAIALAATECRGAGVAPRRPADPVDDRTPVEWIRRYNLSHRAIVDVARIEGRGGRIRLLPPEGMVDGGWLDMRRRRGRLVGSTPAGGRVTLTEFAPGAIRIDADHASWTGRCDAGASPNGRNGR